MKIYTALQIGDYHLNHCEDYLFTSLTRVKKLAPIEEINPINFLVIDKVGMENEEMLHVKLKKLEFEFGLKPTDDLALVRIAAD